MSVDLSTAKQYVTSVDLSGTPRGIIAQDAATEAGPIFEQAKNQAQVVGSGVFSFAKGVDPKVREAVSNSALLAQLVANKSAAFDASPRDWFKAYANVLEHLGWVLADAGWADYSASGTAVEVNEKILEVMAVVLGPAPAALAIMTATVNALKAMNPGSSWITIFSRESQKAKIARFQLGLAENDGGSLTISLVACVVEANNTITQVLFFKFKDADATFSANSSKVSVDPDSLVDLGPAIRSKVRAYIADYVSSITDL